MTMLTFHDVTGQIAKLSGKWVLCLLTRDEVAMVFTAIDHTTEDE